MGRSVPFPSPPVAGEIMWLPRHDPTYTVDEKKLNHPVLVLYSLPGGTCWFLIVSSPHHGRICYNNVFGSIADQILCMRGVAR